MLIFHKLFLSRHKKIDKHSVTISNLFFRFGNFTLHVLNPFFEILIFSVIDQNPVPAVVKSFFVPGIGNFSLLLSCYVILAPANFYRNDFNNKF